MKSESEVTQSCPTLCDPMDCSLPGSSVYGIFQARVLEWGAIAFSKIQTKHQQIQFRILQKMALEFLKYSQFLIIKVITDNKILYSVTAPNKECTHVNKANQKAHL